MKKLTYGLLESSVYIKRVDSQGSFVRSERERFTVNIEKDLVKPMSRFEKAFFQQNKKTSSKVVSADESRELIVRRLGDTVRETPFYIATMCAIGALISLQPLSKGVRLEYVAEAVSTENEHWLKAIDFYNGLFAELTKAGAYSKNALIRADGRMALACMLTGLQVVCDLTKQVFELHEAGRFIEATNIGNQLNKMRVDSMDVYRLLYSPEHPERTDLIAAMREHDSKYELRLDQDSRWVITNKHELKLLKVVGAPEANLEVVELTNKTSLIEGAQKAKTNISKEEDVYEIQVKKALEKQRENALSEAESSEDEPVVSEHNKPEDTEVLASDTLEEQAPQDIDELVSNSSDEDVEADVEQEESQAQGTEKQDTEKGLAEEPEGELEAAEVGGKQKQSTEYQTTRKKRIPTSAMAGAVPSGGLFRAPKNKDSVPIDITNL